jgi:tRNA(Arg) A34 adenosine deaminase TadA
MPGPRRPGTAQVLFITRASAVTLNGVAKAKSKSGASGADFMRRAIELALEGVRSNQGGPFGAVVVKGGVVVGEGCNRVLATNDPTAHAEIEAIRSACAKLGTFELHGAEIYTSCEPCPMCLAAAYWARVERVHFACERGDAARAGFYDSLLYEELAKSPPERTLPLVQTMRDEALATFQSWIDKPDRRSY